MGRGDGLDSNFYDGEIEGAIDGESVERKQGRERRINRSW